MFRMHGGTCHAAVARRLFAARAHWQNVTDDWRRSLHVPVGRVFRPGLGCPFSRLESCLKKSLSPCAACTMAEAAAVGSLGQRARPVSKRTPTRCCDKAVANTQAAICSSALWAPAQSNKEQTVLTHRWPGPATRTALGPEHCVTVKVTAKANRPLPLNLSVF
jgi:hypothetical protein